MYTSQDALNDWFGLVETSGYYAAVFTVYEQATHTPEGNEIHNIEQAEVAVRRVLETDPKVTVFQHDDGLVSVGYMDTLQNLMPVEIPSLTDEQKAAIVRDAGDIR